MFRLLRESKAYFRIPTLYKHAPCDFAYFSGLDIHLLKDILYFPAHKTHFFFPKHVT